MRQNITETIWYDPDVKNYIMLDVTDDIMPLESQYIEGRELFSKAEYHCSLVPAGKLSDDPDVVAQVIQDVTTYLTEVDVHFKGLVEKYYICEKNAEATLIAPAIIAGVEGLTRVVRRVVPEYVPALLHVTLLKSRTSEYGIGINSAADLNAYCREVTIR